MAAVPVVVNLVAAPRLGRAPVVTDRGASDAEGAFGRGAVYVHSHALATTGPHGIAVQGAGGNNDSHLAPGGRESGLRLGMRPGHTYTASVDVRLDAPLASPRAARTPRIAVGTLEKGVINWNFAVSDPAPNARGTSRLSVTFTVPKRARSAWVRLLSGVTAGSGIVSWDRLLVHEGAAAVPYFDGDTPGDRWYTYAWLGDKNASSSVRTMRTPQESFDRSDDVTEVVDEAGRRAVARAFDETRVLEAFARANSASRSPGDTIRSVALRAQGDVEGADAALRAALDADPAFVPALKAAASLAGSEKRWVDAERWWRAAAAASDDPVPAYELATVLQRRGLQPDADRLTRDTAAHDRTAPFPAVEAVAHDPKVFAARRLLGEFVAEHLDEIRDRAQEFHDVQGPGPLPGAIFTLWSQGYQDAPPVVRMCKAALDRHNPGQVHALTDDLLPYYVSIPAEVTRRIGTRRAQFSDAVRIDLLARYGGIWADATCLTATPLRQAVDSRMTGSFLAFGYGGPRISSWFLAARRGDYVTAMHRSAFFLWWERRDFMPDYFLFHHLFEALYWLDDRFHTQWDESPRLDARPPHALQRAMFSHADGEVLRELVHAEFVHKLKYQYGPESVELDGVLAALIRSSGLST